MEEKQNWIYKIQTFRIIKNIFTDNTIFNVFNFFFQPKPYYKSLRIDLTRLFIFLINSIRSLLPLSILNELKCLVINYI